MPAPNNTQYSKKLESIVSSSSIIGRAKKSGYNEDYKYHDKEHNIYIVADGLGGHPNGHEASRIATENLAHQLKRLYKGLTKGYFKEEDISFRINEAASYVNNEIMVPIAQMSRVNRNFGTTIAGIFIYKDTSYVFNAGDSDAFIYQNNELTKLTNNLPPIKLEDDVSEAAKITDKIENAKVHQYFGKQNMNLSQYQEKTNKGDIILLATDGLTKFVHPKEIQETIQNAEFKYVINRLNNIASYPIKITELYSQEKEISMRKAKIELGKKSDDTTTILIGIR